MREKSQLDDMRAAIRGDLERARARREADPWRPQDPETPAGDVVPAEGSDRLKPVTAGPAVEPAAEAPGEGLTPEGSVPTEAPEPEPAAADAVPAEGSDRLKPVTAGPAVEPIAKVPGQGLTPKGSVPIETPEPEPAAPKKSFFARLFGRG